MTPRCAEERYGSCRRRQREPTPPVSRPAASIRRKPPRRRRSLLHRTAPHTGRPSQEAPSIAYGRAGRRRRHPLRRQRRLRRQTQRDRPYYESERSRPLTGQRPKNSRPRLGALECGRAEEGEQGGCTGNGQHGLGQTGDEPLATARSRKRRRHRPADPTPASDANTGPPYTGPLVDTVQDTGVQRRAATGDPPLVHFRRAEHSHRTSVDHPPQHPNQHPASLHLLRQPKIPPAPSPRIPR